MYNCDTELIYDITDGKSLLGNIAHIESLNENGPRFNENLTIKQRNAEDNLIVLCPTCHEKVDSDPKKYTVDYLKNMKEDHIKNMRLVKENYSINFDFDDLYYASKNIISNKIELPIDKIIDKEDFTLADIDYKLNRNDLTSITKNNIISGLVQQKAIEDFFVFMSKENESFYDLIKNSLQSSYESLKQKYHGDFLFLAIYNNFKEGLTENQQNACLAIIVYFFTICELFET